MYHIMIDEPPDESIVTYNMCIIELTNDTNITKIHDEKIECPICFENIEDIEGILIMDCCKKIIHLTCLVHWYTACPRNLVCIMCNQNNIFCDNLVYNESVTQISESDNSSTQSNYSPTQSNYSPTQSNYSPTILNNSRKCCRNLIIIIIIIIILLATLIVILCGIYYL